MNAPTSHARTPRLDALLDRLRRRLVAQVFVHGLATVVVALGVWLAFAFIADRVLSVPAPVRWLHLAVLIALPAAVLVRALLGPLRRAPDRDGMAILIERAHPELSELVVSAVQLAQSPTGSPELCERTIALAEERAEELSIDEVFDLRGPRRRVVVALTTVAVLAFGAWWSPLQAEIFLRRLFGGDVPWPQRTHLALSIPLSDRALVEETPEAIRVRVARGADVPVLVRANGEVPSEVLLSFEGGRELVLTPTGTDSFRTLLRSCQEDLVFSATGGDDRAGRPRVEITVLEPPDIGGLAVTIRPPAYTGRPERVVFDRDVEVFAGSELDVVMQPIPAEATGSVHLLPADQTRALEPRPFPPREESLAPVPGLGFELVAETSLRFRFELVDSTGLANPDPGLFAVDVVTDREPDLTWLAPSRAEIDTSVRGRIPLLVRAEDDFGLTAVRWHAARGDVEGQLTAGEMQVTRLAQSPEARVSWLGSAHLDVAGLAPAEELALGTQIEVTASASDNRPQPNVGESSPLRVRIVSEEELLRRVQDRLVRVRGLVGELETLARDKAARVDELIATLESDGPSTALSESELSAARTGGRRVQGDARSIGREIAAVCETVLFARLDEKAEGLLGHVEAAYANVTDQRFQAELWLELAAATREGRLGTPGFAGQLVGLAELALTISEIDALEAVRALESAVDANEIEGVHAALTLAASHQARAIGHIEDLLERLAEWDNFQSILTLTRDILNRQKALEERTRRVAREK